MSVAEPLRRPFGLRVGTAAAAKPAARPVARPRPRLVLVAPARPAAGRIPFVILLGVVLVGGLLLLLMLHTLAAQDGFTINKLQQRLTTLTDTEQGLEQQVQADSGPAALRARASALGMLPSTVAAYHKLHGGRAIGIQQPVYSPPPVTAPVSTTTTTSTSAHAASTSTKSAGKATKSKSAAAPKSATTASSGTTTATTTHHRSGRHHHGATAKQ